MDLLPTFRLGLMNAWWLILPLVLTTVYICAMKKELARRMSDMTGYDAGERIFTVSASFAPYPFMIVTVWTPFTTLKPVLYSGLALYLMGAVLFLQPSASLSPPLSTGYSPRVRTGFQETRFTWLLRSCSSASAS